MPGPACGEAELLIGSRLLRLCGDHGGIRLAGIGDRLVVGLARLTAARDQRPRSRGVRGRARLLGLRLDDRGLCRIAMVASC
jgi:hypothetical protein